MLEKKGKMRRIARKRCKNSSPRSTDADGRRQKKGFENPFFFGLYFQQNKWSVFEQHVYKRVKWQGVNWQRGWYHKTGTQVHTCDDSFFVHFYTAPKLVNTVLHSFSSFWPFSNFILFQWSWVQYTMYICCWKPPLKTFPTIRKLSAAQYYFASKCHISITHKHLNCSR